MTHLAGLLAGSDVRYDVGDDHPLSGLMVPDLVLDDGRRVAELLHDARPVLLDLSGGARPRQVAAAWADRVDVVVACDGRRASGDADPARRLRRLGRRHIRARRRERLRAALTRWFGA